MRRPEALQSVSWPAFRSLTVNAARHDGQAKRMDMGRTVFKGPAARVGTICPRGPPSGKGVFAGPHPPFALSTTEASALVADEIKRRWREDAEAKS